VYSNERTLKELADPKAWQKLLASSMPVVSAAFPR